MKTLYFDCFCGASGDMIVGALIDAGADFAKIEAGLASLGLTGYKLSAERVMKHGVGATQFRVAVDEDTPQPHRHLSDIEAIIAGGALPEEVKAASSETFRRIADAEAEVHGTTPEKIHFHEVGAVDSIVDIVAAHLALHDLGVERVLASPLRVGYGTVKCAHGVLPVPAPATALLLKGAPAEGAPVAGGDVKGELVTPTGAALVTQLADGYGPMPSMHVESVGYGCGTKDFEDRANVLRVFLGTAEATSPGTESIVVMETNIDDMNPELLPVLVADLLREGARDAFLTPIVAKKGRPAHAITVLCDEAKVQAMAAVLFRGSTTLGLRMRTEQRMCLKRAWKTVATPWGDVRIKLGYLRDELQAMAPEFEECREVAERAGVAALAVYRAALAAAERGEWNNG